MSLFFNYEIQVTFHQICHCFTIAKIELQFTKFVITIAEIGLQFTQLNFMAINLTLLNELLLLLFSSCFQFWFT